MSTSSTFTSAVPAHVNRADELEAIRQLKPRYFRFIDTRSWTCWRDVFTNGVVGTFENAVSANGAGDQAAPTWEGVDVLVSSIRAAIEDCVTVHQGLTSEIVLESATSASGLWAMSDIVAFPNGYTLDGAGHYHETYLKTDGSWRIDSIHLTRTRMEFVPPTVGP